MATEHLKGEDVFEGSEDRVLRAVGDLITRHAAEHAGAPGGIVAGGLVIVFLGFGHAFTSAPRVVRRDMKCEMASSTITAMTWVRICFLLFMMIRFFLSGMGGDGEGRAED